VLIPIEVFKHTLIFTLPESAVPLIVQEVCVFGTVSNSTVSHSLSYIATDPPIAGRVNISVCLNTSIGINTTAGASDPNGDPVTYSYGLMTGPGAADW